METSDLLHAVNRATGQAFTRATPCSGGLVNLVWRVSDGNKTAIAKVFLDHLAIDASVPMSPERLHFEVNGLRLASRFIGAEHVPAVLAMDPDRGLVVLEDLGFLRDLRDKSGQPNAVELCRHLGRLIARLHNASAGDPDAATHRNLSVQQTRNAVQYQSVADWVPGVGSEIIQRVTKVSEVFVGPGRCLTMGDLWPASVLVHPRALKLIDWEFSHYGQPEQDVAHMAAHLWMLEHTQGLKQLESAFVESYWSQAELVDAEFEEGFVVHRACEILIRSVGPFQAGYVYDGNQVMAKAAADHALAQLALGPG